MEQRNAADPALKGVVKMRRVFKALVLTAAVAFVSAPVHARADSYVSPWAGVNFGNDQYEGDWTYGVNIGNMGAGIIGFEFGLGVAPNFFGEGVDNSVIDVMGNIIVGIPVGGTSGAGVRPYVTGGLGLIRTNIDAPGLDATNDFGFNLGAGLMGYFTDNIGLRGDVRYLRTINSEDLEIDEDDFPDFDFGGFDYWRAAIGLVVRF
jgi:opacity protein-like surface antigen